MRTMSIPRLELQAAVLGTRLMDTVKQEHGVAISSCTLWADSKTVLYWIISTHRRYKQFVGNRVAEILESTEVSQWRWLPSTENEADDATISQRRADISQCSRWLSGPPFLMGPEESWPKVAEEEEMSGKFVNLEATIGEIPQKFWWRLTVTYASCGRHDRHNRRWAHCRRIGLRQMDGHLSSLAWTISDHSLCRLGA